jgi:hypothetical protein
VPVREIFASYFDEFHEMLCAKRRTNEYENEVGGHIARIGVMRNAYITLAGKTGGRE